MPDGAGTYTKPGRPKKKHTGQPKKEPPKLTYGKKKKKKKNK